MFNLQLIAGIDIPAIKLGLTIHQPTIKEISYIGEREYFSALQLLCFDKRVLLADDSKGTSNLLNKNNFEIFMTLINGPDATEQKNRILSVFTLLLPAYQVQFLPRSIFCNSVSLNHNLVIDETNFDDLREIVKEIGGLNHAGSGTNGSYNPVGPMAAEIAAKLMRGRARAAQANSGDSVNSSVLARYVSILTVGLQSMSLNDCLNLTIPQLYDLVERYNLYIGWDLDIRSRLAGGKPQDQPDDWMKNIH